MRSSYHGGVYACVIFSVDSPLWESLHTLLDMYTKKYYVSGDAEYMYIVHCVQPPLLWEKTRGFSDRLIILEPSRIPSFKEIAIFSWGGSLAVSLSLFFYWCITWVIRPQPDLRSPPPPIQSPSSLCISSTQTTDCYWSKESLLSFIGYRQRYMWTL